MDHHRLCARLVLDEFGMNDSGLLGMGDDAWMDGVRDDSDGTRVSGFGFGVTARGLGLFSERRAVSRRVVSRDG